MKVRELIALLEKVENQDLHVYLESEEVGTYDLIDSVQLLVDNNDKEFLNLDSCSDYVSTQPLPPLRTFRCEYCGVVVETRDNYKSCPCELETFNEGD